MIFPHQISKQNSTKPHLASFYFQFWNITTILRNEIQPFHASHFFVYCLDQEKLFQYQNQRKTTISVPKSKDKNYVSTSVEEIKTKQVPCLGKTK